jgi:hypothetical protein
VSYDGTLDVEEYIDEGIIKLAAANDGVVAENLINRTFALLNNVEGRDTLRRFENGHHIGKVGLVELAIAKTLTEESLLWGRENSMLLGPCAAAVGLSSATAFTPCYGCCSP